MIVMVLMCITSFYHDIQYWKGVVCTFTFGEVRKKMVITKQCVDSFRQCMIFFALSVVKVTVAHVIPL